jgi:MFS family permease
MIGDFCAHVAASWWILDKTGSAAEVASVIAPAMLVRTLFLPLIGPLGDKFIRKWIIVYADIWRGALAAIIAVMALTDYFNLSIVIAVYVLMALGNAAFASVSRSIVPQLVEPDRLPKAMQQSQAIEAMGRVAGGVVGGIVVSAMGVGGAFVVNTLSYAVSAVSAGLIKANTKPKRDQDATPQASGYFREWFTDLKNGFHVITKIPILFWMAVVSMILNFVFSPIEIILPVMVKEVRGLPPWFLGTLFSSLGAGAIVGALTVGMILKRIPMDICSVGGIIMIGLGVAFMPWVPNIALPLVMMFIMGAGMSFANIPMETKEAMSLPDHFRSRVTSLSGFMSSIAAPLGVSFGGYLIANIGLDVSLLGIGLTVAVLAPLMFAIPKYIKFMRADDPSTRSFFTDHYPNAFSERT